MTWRSFLKPLALLGLLALYLLSLSVIGLLMLATNPLTDQRLPMRGFFEWWPLAMLTALVALAWQHRERGVWWLAVAIGAAPLAAVALMPLFD